MTIEDPLLTVSQVAERLQVKEATVRQWLRNGQLAGYILSDRAGWRVRQSDLVLFLETRYRPAGKLVA